MHINFRKTLKIQRTSLTLTNTQVEVRIGRHSLDFYLKKKEICPTDEKDVKNARLQMYSKHFSLQEYNFKEIGCLEFYFYPAEHLIVILQE